MVCKKCEKKLTTVAAPDPFRPSSSTRVIGENKLLTSKARANPYARPVPGGVLGKGKAGAGAGAGKCVDCKCNTQQVQATRCQKCAYKKGLCAICGTIILDTSRYKQTNK